MSRDQADDAFTFNSDKGHARTEGFPRVQLVCQVLVDAFAPVLFGTQSAARISAIAGMSLSRACL